MKTKELPNYLKTDLAGMNVMRAIQSAHKMRASGNITEREAFEQIDQAIASAPEGCTIRVASLVDGRVSVSNRVIVDGEIVFRGGTVEGEAGKWLCSTSYLDTLREVA